MLTTENVSLLHDGSSVVSARAEYLIALIPTAAWAVYQNGLYAVLTALLSVLIVLGADIAYKLICEFVLKTGRLTFDPTPIVYGILIAFVMPPRTAIWVLLLADLAVIAVYRLLSGIVSPVALGCTLVLLLTADFTHFVGDRGEELLDSLIAGVTPNTSTFDMAMGRMSGGLGDVSGVLIILGGIYLMARRHIAWEVPAASLVTVAVIASLITPPSIAYSVFIIGQLFCGSTVFASVFVAADTAHLPISSLGRLIFGVAVGAMTMLSRVYLGFNGIYPAVLLMSLLTPLIDRLIRPVMFGGSPKKYDRNILKKL